MNNRKLDDKKLREIQMKNGGKVCFRFFGFSFKPPNLPPGPFPPFFILTLMKT